MQTGTLKTKPAIKIDGPVNALLHSFNLSTQVEKKKHRPAWLKRELNSMVLLDRPDRKVILTTFHDGVEIDSFHSNDSLTLQIIRGKLKFQTRKGSIILNEDQSYTLDENIHYRLTTGEETVFLLTITSGKL
jgi:quercetin dioxygenase-like cupin family protein